MMPSCALDHPWTSKEITRRIGRNQHVDPQAADDRMQILRMRCGETVATMRFDRENMMIAELHTHAVKL
jgi:hypothetical protein